MFRTIHVYGVYINIYYISTSTKCIGKYTIPGGVISPYNW